MMRKLAACECGGQPAVKSVSYIRGRWFWAQCSSCLARSSDRASLEEAVGDWNQRVRRDQGQARQPRQPRQVRQPRQPRQTPAEAKSPRRSTARAATRARRAK